MVNMKQLLIKTCALLLLMNPIFGSQPQLVPQVESLNLKQGQFELTANTSIESDQASQKSAELLRLALTKSTGFTFASGAKAQTIKLQVSPTLSSLKDEAYQLRVSENEILIEACHAKGIFYGTQTLLQLLPSKIYAQSKQDHKWLIPALEIKDSPRFDYRSMMLDTSRYFFDAEYVKRFLDIMALHKMNIFQWHFIDDAGWRIEIKKYPKLTEIGAFRGKGQERIGGFYTQDQIREIVQYAADRNITIIPEIAMPAHALSAIVSYPELSCLGKEGQTITEMPTTHSIARELYCVGKEDTWQFLTDVMDEVCELFPGPYIHIGGDEAKYDRWKKCTHCQAKIKELNFNKAPDMTDPVIKAMSKKHLKDLPEKRLQGWMTRRIEDYVKTKGKAILGWDEILECDVSKNAAIMPWHNVKSGKHAAQRGNPVVIAFTGHCYFDAPESRIPGEITAATWIPPISFKNAYDWDPSLPGLSPEHQKNILGINSCMWTDVFLHHPRIAKENPPLYRQDTKTNLISEQYVEYLVLPRIAASAEVVWSPKTKQNWIDFQDRMQAQFSRYDRLGWNYRLPIPYVMQSPDGFMIHSAISPLADTQVHYTLDGSIPTHTSPLFKGSLKLTENDKFLAVAINAKTQHSSLAFGHASLPLKFKKYGSKVAQWSAKRLKPNKHNNFKLPLTGMINEAGTYELTFIQTGGKNSVSTKQFTLFKNNTEIIENFTEVVTSKLDEAVSVRFKVGEYETGATYVMHSKIAGNKGKDSKGLILFRKVAP